MGMCSAFSLDKRRFGSFNKYFLCDADKVFKQAKYRRLVWKHSPQVEKVVSLLIDEAKQLPRDGDVMKMRVLPMYGALPAAEQMRVFERTTKNCRKVKILAARVERPYGVTCVSLLFSLMNAPPPPRQNTSNCHSHSNSDIWTLVR